jgi:hypothetical protein|tara:strand:+ start:255 stop:512 length:258 start_codon:yes stop_codon:yes gene_type:complete
MSEKKKPPHIRFYCKECKKLGRRDWLYGVKDMPGHKPGVSIQCIPCLHDKGYRFKGWNYGDKDETPRVHEDEIKGGRNERYGEPS